MNATRFTTARNLRTAVLRAGFRRGAPPHVTPATLIIDLRNVRLRRCPVCEKKTLRGEAYQNGRRFRLLAVCTVAECQAAEEV